MLDFEVTLVNVFRYAQVTRYTAPFASVSLTISGLRWMLFGSVRLESPGALLTVHPAGEVHQFEYGPQRENWVALMDTADIRPDAADDRFVQIRSCGRWCRLPRWVSVGDELVNVWRDEFRQMRQAFNSPSPLSEFRVRCGVSRVLGHLIDSTLELPDASPAGRLKALLDEDAACTTTLETLCAGLHYSTDHLRRLFHQAYGLSPVQYRIGRRAAAAAMLLSGGALTVKEVAARLGFAHVSQFSAFCRQHMHRSPSQIMHRMRPGGAIGL